jgi:hypothetical protein
VLHVVLGSRQELKARVSVDALSNLLIPILAGLVGLFNSFRMMRLPDPKRPVPPRAWSWAAPRVSIPALTVSLRCSEPV